MVPNYSYTYLIHQIVTSMRSIIVFLLNIKRRSSRQDSRFSCDSEKPIGTLPRQRTRSRARPSFPSEQLNATPVRGTSWHEPRVYTFREAPKPKGKPV